MATKGLLLTPGASATREHSSLVTIDETVSAAGFAVERIDLLSSSAKPERHIALIAEASERMAVDRLFLGGRSMGGRMCSMAVAAGLEAAGLVLVSYPLHPPGKPRQTRTAHFPAINVPCLFVSGTKDTFGTPAELKEATTAIRGPITHVWIEGGNHGLRGKDQAAADAVRNWLLSFV